MPFFAKATLDLPYADGADDERRQLEDKHSRLIYAALRKLMRLVAPADTTVANITPDIAVQRYRDNQHILRDALVAMLTDGAMLGADVGKAQTEAAMGVGVRKATPTITGVDWDLINDDVLQWVMGGGLGGSSFGQGYADTLATAMAGTSERGLRTLIGEWVRNDLSYRQLVTDLERSLFSRSRAEMVTSTEITRAYAEGNRAAWQRGGIITQMQWFTAGAELTCPICRQMNGQIADVRGSFGSGLFPPAHPRCRCTIQPWIGEITQQLASSPESSMTNAIKLQFTAEPAQLLTVNKVIDSALQRLAPRNGTTPAEMEESVRQIFEQMAKNNDIAIQFKSTNLEFLFADDRLKTQFETNKSGGALNTKYRATAEAKGLGAPLDLAPKERPIYGFLDFGKKARQNVDAYGDITFVLKSEARTRSTVTVDDSLSNFDSGRVAGTPLNAPSRESWDGWIGALYEHAKGGKIEDFLDVVPYVEVQIQGGVTLRDVGSVIDTTGILSASQRRQLEERGIEIRTQ